MTHNCAFCERLAHMLLGAKLPNSGPRIADPGIPAMARAIEEAGFASAWVSDHIVMPEQIDSRYPFAADGRATWSPAMPWADALVALALAAAVTERVRLGTAVLVLGLRNPVEFAKATASIDVAAGGRLELGVGAGWLKEEFDALGAPFARRGARLDEWMAIARTCWTGRPEARSSEHYELPAGVLCFPTPVSEPPFLIGGHSPAALRRAGRVGDGWLAHQALDELDPEELARGRDAMREAARDAGRDADAARVVLRIVGSAGRAAEVAPHLAALEAAGVEEVVVDVDWDTEGPRDVLLALQAGVPA